MTCRPSASDRPPTVRPLASPSSMWRAVPGGCWSEPCTPRAVAPRRRAGLPVVLRDEGPGGGGWYATAPAWRLAVSSGDGPGPPGDLSPRAGSATVQAKDPSEHVRTGRHGLHGKTIGGQRSRRSTTRRQSGPRTPRRSVSSARPSRRRTPVARRAHRPPCRSTRQERSWNGGGAM